MLQINVVVKWLYWGRKKLSESSLKKQLLGDLFAQILLNKVPLSY